MDCELFEKVSIDDTDKRLFVTRENGNERYLHSSCNMSPADVDYEMSFQKSEKVLQIFDMNQESFEYFIEKYGETYEYLYFCGCKSIYDFSPLSKLQKLKAVKISWNIRSDGLWDMSENESLTHLAIFDSKMIIRNLKLLNTGKKLKYIKIAGDIFSKSSMEDLSAFENMDSLETITLYNVKLNNRDISFLKTLPNLMEFNFEAGLLTTEEIAYICARYPHIYGESLCAYNKGELPMNVRICGYRKPSLALPKGEKRLQQYIAEFNALVEKYKTEELTTDNSRTANGKELSEYADPIPNGDLP
ncbi:MAG: hypothetical protein IKD31_01600 [Clostridia bacterium]|nr:hypothetical protein [Clostridia bacterium]